MTTGKTPAEILNFLADFSAEIAANEPTDTISSAAVAVLPTDVTASGVAVNTARTGVTMQLSGGTAQTAYTVTTTATMTSGQIFQRSFFLPCVAARG